ncbi:MAG: thiamine-phosphate kinase [Pelagibacterales bacterium]|nr:thiamine-phosphate kinase [Pelagibacterales bacterium]
MHEFELINKYFAKLTNTSKGSLNLNDDVFFDKKKNLVVSVDTYIEGKHFINFKNPELTIKKVIRASISDLICKGVKPKYYFVSASGNNKVFTKGNLTKISKSLREEQKRYNIILGGGDTVYSNELSFTVTSIGFSNKIIYRNRSKINDDIYVTGNLGDSFIGLLVLKKKIKINKKLSSYFINQYYKPEIKYSLTDYLNKIATSSIDLSDGLISDLEKLTNNQNNSYQIYFDKIPLSSNLKSVINSKNLLKKNLISKGDDYQVLFTANYRYRSFIKKISSLKKLKITLIGKILHSRHKSSIIDRNGHQIKISNKGYTHIFD